MRKLLLVKRKVQLKYVGIIILATLCAAFAGYQGAHAGSVFWTSLVLSLVVGVESSLILARFIGPIYGFEKNLRRLTSGDLTIKFHCRDDDEISDLVKTANEMLNGFRERIYNDRKAVLDTISELNIIVTQLQEHASGIANREEILNHLSTARDKISHITAGFKL